MKRIHLKGLDLWQFENLSADASIRHFVSGRNSNAGGPEFTLSLSSLPDKDTVRGNRRLVATALGIPDEHLYFPSQVHETRIVHVTPRTKREALMATDALITDHASIGIAVMSADCVPILLYDKTHHAIGAVHSGWRGTAKRILEKTLAEMHRAFGTQGKDIIAGIGPSVSQESYEVGEEVAGEITQAFPNAGALLIPQPLNKAKLDLWKANEVQLLEFGVPESQIEISGLCTVKNNDHFFSARKGDSGRFAAGILLAT